MSKPTKSERAEACDRLHRLLRPGDTVYAIVRSVSRSGMSRKIDFYTLDDGPVYLSGYIATVAGYPRDKSGALKVQGCGMDMAFSVTYNLGRALFPDGVPCVGEGCLSNDHSNGDRDYTPDGAVSGCKRKRCTCHMDEWGAGRYLDGCSSCGCHRVEHKHADGGYAFRSEIL